MSKFIVALTLPEFGSTPNSPTSGFYKYYLRSHWLKVLNSAGLQKDVVLDRPLDGFVADNPPCLPILSTDTVLTAFEKFQCIMNNLVIITGSMKAATPWTVEHTTTNNDQYQVGTIVYYMNSVYKCILANDSILPTNATYWQYLGVADGYYSQEQADWDATTGSSYIRNKPTIPPAPVQSDWTQSDNTQLDFIKNKPTDVGFNPLDCNAKIITNQLDSCNATLEIQKDAAYQVKLQGHNIGKGPGLTVSNTVFGFEALHLNSSSTNNVAIGWKALRANTTGSNNIAIGAYALALSTQTSTNIAIGTSALSSLATATLSAQYNVAIGYESLKNTNPTNGYNTAVGYGTLLENTTGYENNAFGYRALAYNTTGINNVGIGNTALEFNTTGQGNTAVGFESMIGYSNLSTGSRNTALGKQSLKSLRTGVDNVAIGCIALNLCQDGNNNVTVGKGAGASNISGSQNVLIGMETGNATTSDNNTAVGYQAMLNNTSGTYNVALGHQALYSNTIKSGNTALGYQAFKNLNETNNTAVGYNAGYYRTLGTGNTMIGWQAGFGQSGLTIGNNNTAVGDSALSNLSSGTNNTAVGTNSSSNVTTGNYNVALGQNALRGAALSGDDNVGIGRLTLYNVTTGDKNIAVGYNSLNLVTTGSGNIGIGSSTLEAITTGINNVAIGASAGARCTGEKNVFIGNTAGTWQTAVTNRLFVHNKSVGDSTNEEAISLITGTFDPTDDITLQKIQFNAVTTINNVLKLKPRASDPTGADAVAGAIYYNSGSNVIKFHNGTAWKTVLFT